MKTFGFIGEMRPGGLYGLGEMRDGVLIRGVVTTRFNVVDGLHPTPHNGADVSSLETEDATLFVPLDGIVASNIENIWTGPGPKTLYDFVDANGNRITKVVQPGDYDRGGIEVVIIHPGPWLLPDGTVVANAATRYCHLREMPPLAVGTTVRAGDVLGRQGTTGYSTGAHLHWALKFQREPIGFFPGDMGDVATLSDPLAFVGVPVVDVAEPSTLPTVRDLSRISAAALTGNVSGDVRITPVEPGAPQPTPNDGWAGWIMEVQK